MSQLQGSCSLDGDTLVCRPLTIETNPGQGGLPTKLPASSLRKYSLAGMTLVSILVISGLTTTTTTHQPINSTHSPKPQSSRPKPVLPTAVNRSVIINTRG